MKSILLMAKAAILFLALYAILAFVSHEQSPPVNSDQYRNGFYAGCVIAYHQKHMPPKDIKVQCMKTTLETTKGLTFSSNADSQFEEFTNIINSYLEQYKT